LEEELENKTAYIKSVEISLAELSSRVDATEGKLCRCHEVQVEVEDDPSSELSYEEEYFTPTIRIAGMIKDVPRLIPIGEVEVTPGGFDEVRDGDVELESVASRVTEQALQEEEESSEGTDIEQFMYLVGPICSCPLVEYRLIDPRILIQSQRDTGLPSTPSSPWPNYVIFRMSSRGWMTPEFREVRPGVTYVNVGVQADLLHQVSGASVRQLIQETVQQNSLNRVIVKLEGIRSSLGELAGASELILTGGLSRTQEMIAAFLPTVVEGDVTPESVKGRHLIEEGEEEEEGEDGEGTSL